MKLPPALPPSLSLLVILIKSNWEQFYQIACIRKGGGVKFACFCLLFCFQKLFPKSFVSIKRLRAKLDICFLKKVRSGFLRCNLGSLLSCRT